MVCIIYIIRLMDISSYKKLVLKALLYTGPTNSKYLAFLTFVLLGFERSPDFIHFISSTHPINILEQKGKRKMDSWVTGQEIKWTWNHKKCSWIFKTPPLYPFLLLLLFVTSAQCFLKPLIHILCLFIILLSRIEPLQGFLEVSKFYQIWFCLVDELIHGIFVIIIYLLPSLL